MREEFFVFDAELTELTGIHQVSVIYEKRVAKQLLCTIGPRGIDKVSKRGNRSVREMQYFAR